MLLLIFIYNRCQANLVNYQFGLNLIVAFAKNCGIGLSGVSSLFLFTDPDCLCQQRCLVISFSYFILIQKMGNETDFCFFPSGHVSKQIHSLEYEIKTS